MGELQLISISPKDVLTFELQKDVSPRHVFTVTNSSTHKVAFKVKTTQPSWYYVRPNQQVLGPGESEEISVVLVDAECNRVLKNLATVGTEENLEKHRFLVMSRIISDENYSAVTSASGATSQERQEGFSKLWTDGEAAGEEKGRNHKMRVEFVYPPTSGAGTGSESSRGKSAGEAKSTSESVELIRQQLAASVSALGSSSAGAAAGASASTATVSSPGESPAVYGANDLQILKSKYDTIVEYTVHLTAERDMVSAQLDVLKREFNSEVNKKKGDKKSSPRASKAGEVDKEKEKPPEAKGFSLVFVILVAFIFLLLGRYS